MKISQLISRQKLGWINIVISIVGILFGALNNGFTKFYFALPFLILFIVQIKYVNKAFASILLVIVVAFGVYIGWDLPHSKLLYPVLNEDVIFSGDWVAVKHKASSVGDYYENAISLVSNDMAEKRRCEEAKFVPAGYPKSDTTECKINPEARNAYLLEYNIPFTQMPNKFVLKIESIDGRWNEGSGNTLLVFLTDSDGLRYYIRERDLMDAIKNGYSFSSSLARKDGINNCWGVQSCWSRF